MHFWNQGSPISESRHMWAWVTSECGTWHWKREPVCSWRLFPHPTPPLGPGESGRPLLSPFQSVPRTSQKRSYPTCLFLKQIILNGVCVCEGGRGWVEVTFFPHSCGSWHSVPHLYTDLFLKTSLLVVRKKQWILRRYFYKLETSRILWNLTMELILLKKVWN